MLDAECWIVLDPELLLVLLLLLRCDMLCCGAATQSTL